MADLVSMRAEAAEARQKIDTILGVDGELTTDQVAELEKADNDFKRLQEEVRKAEVLDSARESLAAPSFEFRGGVEKSIQQRSNLDVRQQFQRDLLNEIRRPGSFERRFIDFASGETGATGNAIDLLPVDLQNEMIRLLGSMSAVRQAATVRSFPNDVEIPAVSTRATITAYTGEGEDFDNFDPDFSKLRIRSFKSAAETKITEEVLSDSRGGVVQEILNQHAEAHAFFWEGKFLGTGNAQNATDVDGILTSTFSAVPGAPADTTMASTKTAIADVTYQNLVDTAFGMEASYWNLPKSWIVGPAMFRHLIGLADGNQRPLLLPAATGTASDSRAEFNLLGYPVHVSDAMPADGADTFVAVLMSRDSYVVADRANITSMVDPYGANGAAGLTAYRTFVRSDGRWIRPSSTGRLKTAAS
tara:strand:+ start:3366 stop:4616 length:1251 start_codon:yes stop_codon:yes gene_type:complete